ncbi:hypothetical protein E6C60_0777 [Paenibacillus algicola]|uniref:Uncharacterized protein n=1 Tax=Paenibacillus algicola TaxID=2565926 RepID=A0A4P8XGV2_9BACL|nr:hypothetical protein E6C60_0777 [Paenibacillus algicola]
MRHAERNWDRVEFYKELKEQFTSFVSTTKYISVVVVAW